MFRLVQDGDVARLTLDRPEARNAIPAAGWRWLEAAAGEVAGSDARLLVVTGAGGAFCAGADLGDFAAMRDDEAARIAFRTGMRAAFDALRTLEVPTIAAVGGPCYGAGVALAMACDIRVASEAARFAITPARIGLSFPQEDVHRLGALVGPGQASRLLFTGETIDAAEAHRIGLVEQVGGEAELIASILANEDRSLAALKQAIAVAAAGVRSDAGQDAAFDDLIAGDVLARRLEGRKRT